MLWSGFSAVVLAVLFATMICESVNARAIEVMVAGNVGVEVQGFESGIMRVVLRPKGSWVYEVEHALVAPPMLDESLGTKCDASEKTCMVTHGDCTMRIQETVKVVPADTKEAPSGIEQEVITEPAVSLSYSCGPVELVHAVVPIKSIERPTPCVHFPAAQTLYGLPEHAADLALRAENTYELFNTDAFKYAINSTAPLYGAVPFMMAYGPTTTAGFIFHNSAPMKVTVRSNAQDHPGCVWASEAGLADFFFLPGPTPSKAQQQHAYLMGSAALPPYFSIGFHQCRWNYLSTRDCLAIDEGFDTHNFPYDVLWLDIEHTDRKKYFTWDTDSFPAPKVLSEALASKGRKLVTVKDPHVKRESGYVVHDEAEKDNHYVRDATDKVYSGECWPGMSSWPDFLNARTREWYATFFHHDRYPGGSNDIHTWVDMNEPSVFKGPRGTMHMDAVHRDDEGRKVPHRVIHNQYGFLSIMSAYKGAVEAAGAGVTAERPFILSRSFFLGTQRYAAVWNGDNMARWDHLENTVPELLSLSISNMPFCGVDIGGFFYEPEEELFVRWMQSAVFYPFMRSHAHLETKRREPWTFSHGGQQHIRNALALRYALVPYLYTVFYHTHRHGDTVLRPLIYEFPRQPHLREEQHSFMFGPALLASPIVSKEATTYSALLPSDTLWYNYHTGELVAPGLFTAPADLGTIPLFLRGGYVIPMQLRMRRSTQAMRHDPFTLLVALNQQGNSHGDLYMDDGHSFAYQRGAYLHRRLSFSAGSLSCSAEPEGIAEGDAFVHFNNVTSVDGAFAAANEVERVVVYGYQGTPMGIFVVGDGGDADIPLEYERVGAAIIVRRPRVLVSKSWTINFRNE